MPLLQILLLGPSEVRWDGELISIPRRATRAMLFYLAWRGGMVGRSELLTLFWEDETDTSARASLRQTLARLRQALPNPSIVLAEDDLIGLDPLQVGVDHSEFQHLLAQAGRIPWNLAVRQPLPDHTVQLLRRAANLWRKPQFMAGVALPSSRNLDDWLTCTALQLEELYARVLDRLAEHGEAVGDIAQCLADTHLALQIDDGDDNRHERLLRSLIQSGQREQARRHYLALRQRRGVGDLSPAIENLHRQTLDNSHHTHIPEQTRWNVRPSLAVPFVGRQHELDELERCYQRGGGVIIYGESGLGKTKLVHEFAARLNSAPRPNQAPRLIIANCNPMEEHIPFQVVMDVARNGSHDFKNLPAHWASQFLTLLPELPQWRPDLKMPAWANFEHGKTLIAEACRQIALQITRSQRLVGILDDAQWADDSTLELISYLLARTPFNTHQALIIFLARREESSPALHRTIGDLQTSANFTVINLSRLSQGEVARLAEAALPQVPAGRFVEQIARETGGNPLFLLESLRTLLAQQPQPDYSQIRQFPVSENLMALIRRRLIGLSPATRQTLEVAAIYGNQFTPQAVCRVLDLPLTQASSCLDEWLNAGIVEQTTELQPLAYRFVHDKIREALLLDLNPVRLQEYHRRVAQVLDDDLSSAPQAHRGAHAQASILAQHYGAAGEPGKAFDNWVLAGQWAWQWFAASDATQAFDHAEQLLLQSRESFDPISIYRLYTLWNDMAYALNDVSTLTRINTTLLEVAQQYQRVELTAVALLGLSDAKMALSQFEQGLTYANRAYDFLQKVGHTAQMVRALNTRGVFLYMLSRVEEALQVFKQAVELSAEAADGEVVYHRANTYYQISLIHCMKGWPAAGRDAAMLALDDAVTANHPHAQVTAYSALALARYFLGEFNQAATNARLGLALAERLQAWRMQGYLHAISSMIELSLGNIDQALQHTLTSQQIGEQHGYHDVLVMAYRTHGDIYAALGAFSQAIDFFQRGLEVSDQGFWGLDNLYRLAYVLGQTSQADLARQYFQRVLDQSQQGGLDLVALYTRVSQLMTPIYRQTPGDIAHLAADIQKDIQSRSLIALGLAVEFALGVVALHQQEHLAARAHFERVVEQARLFPYPWIELGAHLRLVKQFQEGPTSFSYRRMADLISLLEMGLPDDLSPEGHCIRQYFGEFRQRLNW